MIPKNLKQKIISWYHEILVHPGVDRKEKTISQHFYWTGMQKDIKQFIKNCQLCQKLKKRTKKYGHLPGKETECVPWEKLCVDLIGLYTIPNKSKPKEPRTLWCVTMIDPATGWVEIKDIDKKQAINIANIVETTWLSRYPWPKVMTFDRGTEFMPEFAQMIGLWHQEKAYNNQKSSSKLYNQKSASNYW